MTGGRPVLLLAAAAGLAVVVAADGGYLARFSPREETTPASTANGTGPVATAAGKAIGNPLSELAATDFAAIAERPLFNPTRAPAPPPEPEPEPTPEPVVEAPPAVDDSINAADFTPLAIASGVNGPTAVIRWNPTGEVFRLKRGQLIQDFEIAAIGDRDVTVARSGKTAILKLFQSPAQPASPADGEDGGAMNPQAPGFGQETSHTARPSRNPDAPKELEPTAN